MFLSVGLIKNSVNVKLILLFDSSLSVPIMKTLILHGVPYNVNDMNQVFLYTKHSTSSSNAASESPMTPAPQIGTYDPETQKLTLFPDWQTKSEEFLTVYRKMLQEVSTDALEKARILQTI